MDNFATECEQKFTQVLLRHHGNLNFNNSKAKCLLPRLLNATHKTQCAHLNKQIRNGWHRFSLPKRQPSVLRNFARNCTSSPQGAETFNSLRGFLAKPPEEFCSLGLGHRWSPNIDCVFFVCSCSPTCTSEIICLHLSRWTDSLILYYGLLRYKEGFTLSFDDMVSRSGPEYPPCLCFTTRSPYGGTQHVVPIMLNHSPQIHFALRILFGRRYR